MSAIAAPLRRPANHAGRATSRAPATRARTAVRHRDEARDRHRAVRAAYSGFIAVLLAGAVFGAVGLNAMAAAGAVEARTLEARVADGERRYGHLVAEVAALEDPTRIRELAEEIGLVRTGPSRYLHVDRTLPSDGSHPGSGSAGTAAEPLKSILSMEP